jgi:hypothetical protein
MCEYCTQIGTNKGVLKLYYRSGRIQLTQFTAGAANDLCCYQQIASNSSNFSSISHQQIVEEVPQASLYASHLLS